MLFPFLHEFPPLRPGVVVFFSICFFLLFLPLVARSLGGLLEHEIRRIAGNTALGDIDNAAVEQTRWDGLSWVELSWDMLS